MKRSILIPTVLVIYLIVMAVIGWPHYIGQGLYWEFIGIIAATLVVIVVLYFLLRRRDRMRAELRKQRDAAERRTFRDDHIR